MIKIEDYFSVMALEYNGKAVTAAENGEILMHFDLNLLSHKAQWILLSILRIRMPV